MSAPPADIASKLAALAEKAKDILSSYSMGFHDDLTKQRQAKEFMQLVEKEISEVLAGLPQSPAQMADLREGIAKLLWERFAPEHEVGWPPHSVDEYRSIAAQIVAFDLAPSEVPVIGVAAARSTGLPEPERVEEKGRLYRFLAPGEVMLAGDEYPTRDLQRWEPVGKIWLGMAYAEGLVMVRRRVGSLRGGDHG